MLDNYGDNSHKSLLNNFNEKYSEFKQIKKLLEDINAQIQAKEQKRDFLEFQINEISNAKIQDADEYEALIRERDILLNAESLKDMTFSSYSVLYGQENSIIDMLNSLENKLLKASQIDNNLCDIVEELSSGSINLKEIADQLRSYSEGLEVDAEQLSYIEERIDVLDKLKRKYGPELSDVMDKLQKFEQELEEIELNSEKTQELSNKLNIIERELKDIVEKLSLSRIKLAQLLSELIQKSF
ncbi:MAG: hypothetical protein MZV70_01525 [Desulfobacterales bacterium]|nr:hypothetical protein [Desulfobacterales bacterium]